MWYLLGELYIIFQPISRNQIIFRTDEKLNEKNCQFNRIQLRNIFWLYLKKKNLLTQSYAFALPKCLLWKKSWNFSPQYEFIYLISQLACIKTQILYSSKAKRSYHWRYRERIANKSINLFTISYFPFFFILHIFFFINFSIVSLSHATD